MNDCTTGKILKRGLLTVLALMLVAMAPVQADKGEEGDWELGLFGGYAFLDDYEGGPATLNPDDDALFGVRIGYFFTPRVSFEGSFQTLSSETDLDAGPPNFDFDVRSFRANLLHNFRPGEKFRPFVTGGVGLEELDADPFVEEGDTSFNLGGGVRWFLGEHFNLRWDGRWVTTEVSGALDERQSNLETSIGLSWVFGGKTADADGDGVRDGRDRCPDTPRGASVDQDGCPIDSDGDGVPDGIDRCPDTPNGVKVDRSGCPLDSDGDGVFDGVDKCPDTPKGASVDASGCPKDSDGDGVFDGLDRCPNTPKGATVDASGCAKDSDGDGVPDHRDKCPDTPRGTKVDEKGCTLLFEEGRATLILRGVNFEFNSDELTRDSRGILDGVAASLVQWPDVRVEVSGHTDSKGSDSYNRQLSQRRAESVSRYLIDKGVAASRLVAKGHGEAYPISDNDTDAGRRQNRRVELKKL